MDIRALPACAGVWRADEAAAMLRREVWRISKSTEAAIFSGGDKGC